MTPDEVLDEIHAFGKKLREVFPNQIRREGRCSHVITDPRIAAQVYEGLVGHAVEMSRMAPPYDPYLDCIWARVLPSGSTEITFALRRRT